MKKFRLIFLVLLIALATVITAAACSNRNDSRGAAPENSSGDKASYESSLILPAGSEERKIVYNVKAVIETEDFEATLDKIESSLGEINEGETETSYISNSDISFTTPHAEITLKIKTEKLSEFLDKLPDMGEVVNKTVSSKDITEQYADAGATLQAYQTELAILQERLEDEHNPSYAFQYTTRINEINKQINYYQSMLNKLDSSVEYSDVTLSIYAEGKAPAKEKYNEKANRVFYGSLEVLGEIFKFLGLAIVAVWPYALIGLGLFFGVKYLRRFLKKKYPDKFGKKKEKKI
jgi:hypothetical protein